MISFKAIPERVLGLALASIRSPILTYTNSATKTTTLSVVHVRKSSSKSFEDTLAAFELQLGKPSLPEIEHALKTEGGECVVNAMAGSSGLMVLGRLDMGAALANMLKNNLKAIQFLVGNPIIADSMAIHNIEAALYAPLRILLFEQEEGCSFVYDLPSSLFGQLKNSEINKVALDLDEKLEKLITSSLAEN